MGNKITDLIWLRTQQLLSNAQYLILLLMPYGFALLYKYFFSEGGDGSNYILFTCLPMLFGISMGTFITSIIAEEKEKNNLKELRLSGVTGLEYIIGSLFYPTIIGISGIVLMPLLIGNVEFVNGYGNYLIISLVTAIVITLINLFIALNVSNLNQGQIISLPVIMIIMFLPMFSLMDSTIATINEYSFMGSFTELFLETSESTFTNQTFYILIIWIVVLVLLNIFTFNTKFNKNKSLKSVLNK